MSNERKQSLFIVAYHGSHIADEVYATLQKLEKELKIDIKTAATIYRKDNGKLKLNHKRRVTVWKGTFGGSAIGLLLAGTGPAVLAGAMVGALIGAQRSTGRREVKKFLDDKLGPHDSALAILVNHADWEAVQYAIAHYGGKQLAVELTPEAAEQIAAIAADQEVVQAIQEEIEVEEETVD